LRQNSKSTLIMKKASLLFIFINLIISCEKYDNTCNCENPLEDIAWLKELKNSMTNCYCERSIFQATYNKQTVFYTVMTDPVCDGVINISLADCNGNILKTYTALDETFTNEVTERKVLYRCKTN
jgi:hypothetical protein